MKRADREKLSTTTKKVAARWSDPEYPPRAEAEKRAVESDALLTEEAALFAVNQAMESIRVADFARLLDMPIAEDASPVAIRLAGDVPMERYADLVALLVAGHRANASGAGASILKAFLGEISSEVSLSLEWHDAVAAPESTERFAVAVVAGAEGESDWEGLAEDAFLHEGRGPRSVKLLFAPRGLAPEPLMDALASFRAVVPPPDVLGGRLSMPKAFLASSGVPHAYGDDLSFLISQGPPEIQPTGHLRWVNYDELAEVEAFLDANHAIVSTIAAPAGLNLSLPLELERLRFGEMHRRDLYESLSRGVAEILGIE